MQWRGTTLSIDADFPVRKLLVYQSVSYQNPLSWYTVDIMGVYIYIYPSILTYPKLMEIGCINPQVDIMGAELPGYNGCILVYIGIMGIFKKEKKNISKPGLMHSKRGAFATAFAFAAFAIADGGYVKPEQSELCALMFPGKNNYVYKYSNLPKIF